MITLNYPLMLILLPLPLLIRKILRPLETHEEQALPVPFFDRYLRFESEISQANAKNKPFLKVLYCVIWSLVVIALARPIYLGPPIAHQKAGRNIMLAVDISGSMQVPDMIYRNQRVRRIDLVKHVAKSFIEKRAGDRIGLILFGTNAFLQSPLSFDRHTVNELLEDASVGLAGNRTAIGDAIGVAIKHLKNIPEKQRILILLTDGANNAGLISPLQSAKLAKDFHVKVYTIGLSSAQVMVNDMFGNRLMTNTVNDLDEQTLEQIAEHTGGQFFKANNSEDLNKIYARINELEPIQQDHEIIRFKQDYFHIPLLLGLILSMLLTLSHVQFTFRNKFATS